MFTNDRAAISAAILDGTIQQVQAEPQQQRRYTRTIAVRGYVLAGGGSGSTAGAHRPLR